MWFRIPSSRPVRAGALAGGHAGPKRAPWAEGLYPFNQAIVIGELGALGGVPFVPWIVSAFTRDPSMLALAAVLGALVGGSVLWIVVRVRDHRERGVQAVQRLARDIAWFSPASFVAGLTLYQPVLFFLTRHLIRAGLHTAVAAVAAQGAAFVLFLLALNGYRWAVFRLTGRLL
jgi:hypothetical protein